ncbi:MAG: hypothetical protein M3033_03640 [Acidobacteriota bacterium]|nr:hypothetical protein [Acidobacteriota bacterium]
MEIKNWKSAKSLFGLLLVVILLLAFLPTNAQTKYKTYSNARYAYSISYPSDLLKPQGEADNGDGQVFKDGEKAEMRVYGSHNALGQTLKLVYQEATSELGTGLTYKILKPTFFVVSGKKDGRIYYRKTVKRGSDFLTFTIEYGETEREIYDKATARIAASFKNLIME